MRRFPVCRPLVLTSGEERKAGARDGGGGEERKASVGDGGGSEERKAILSAAQTTSMADSCFPSSTSLHLAAHSGNLDFIRKLLAWGADRLQRDSTGRIPYSVALKRNHGACAALLNPSSAESKVWPSPLKFICELDLEAKALLEAALRKANREREKKILNGTKYSLPSPSRYDDSADDDACSE
ncbi:hypothetical protein ABZP36_004352 [Zizania latifolia]